MSLCPHCEARLICQACGEDPHTKWSARGGAKSKRVLKGTDPVKIMVERSLATRQRKKELRDMGWTDDEIASQVEFERDVRARVNRENEARLERQRRGSHDG